MKQTSVRQFLVSGRSGGLWLVVMALVACGISTGCQSWLNEPNRSPVALVGSTHATVVAGQTVALDATQSYDPDGDSIRCNWGILVHPGEAAIAIPKDGACLIEIRLELVGGYIAQLNVSDGKDTAYPVILTIEAVAPDEDNQPGTNPSDEVILPAATPCDDGQYCTVQDQEAAETCQGIPRVCPAPLSACKIAVCNEQTDACEEQSISKDSDGDGYLDLACGGRDCDDTRVTVHPGISESAQAGNCADGLDNDCDEKIDSLDPGCAIPWWNAAWTRRVLINADDTLSTEALQDFPVLLALKLSRTDYTAMQAQGQDLRVVDSSGVQLSFEIEAFAKPSSDQADLPFALIWVKLPALRGGNAPTSFALYYGNPAAPSLAVPVPPDVFPSPYQGVYHFKDGEAADSSTLGHHGEIQNDASAVSGALAFDASKSQYVDLGTDLPLLQGTAGATLSAWVMPKDVYSDQTLVGVSVDSTDKKPLGSSRATMYIAGGKFCALGRAADTDSGVEICSPANTLTAGTLYHLTAVLNYAANSNILYVDGKKVATGSGGYTQIATANTTANQSVIAVDEDLTTSFFSGAMDEVRIENCARGETWINYQYRSMEDTLLRYQPEERIP